MDWNFVGERPVTNVVRVHSLAILHRIISMSQLSFWSIAAEHDVKYLHQLASIKFDK